MALNLILGNGGSGKTASLMDLVLKKAEQNKDDLFLYLVPEQFTLSTQNSLVMRSKNKCIMNVDVLSFERLSYRVFEELNISNNEVLEELGKVLILRKVVLNAKDKLKVFKKKVDKPAFLDQVKSMITEFEQYGVKTKDLSDFIDKSEESYLSFKLSDLLTMYEGFIDDIEGRYITSSGLLSRLSEVAEKSNLLKNATISFDGYTGFTPVQAEFLRAIMPMTKDIYATVTIDKDEDPLNIRGEEELFYITKKYVKTLIDAAKYTNTEISDFIYMEDSSKMRFKESPDLAYLEKNIFRGKVSGYKAKAKDIVVRPCLNPHEELYFAAERIKDGVRLGRKYEDFAICTADIETYSDYAKSIFERAGIPVYIDKNEPITYLPYVQYVRNLCEVISEDFTFQSAFSYLKTGMGDITIDEVEELENYCLAARIKNFKGFLSPFVKKKNKMTDDDLSALNDIRERFVTPLINLRNLSHRKNVTVREYANELFNVIKGKCEDIKLYKEVIKVLDKAVSLMGEDVVTFDEFYEIIDAGLNYVKMRNIPMGGDYVIIGDIERTRIENIKELFLIGATTDNIPKVALGTKCLTGRDRQELKEKGLEIAGTEHERAFTQQFYLYMIMSKPENKLYITYPVLDMEDTEKSPSYLIRKLTKLFGDQIIDKEDKDVYVNPEYDFTKLILDISKSKVAIKDKRLLAYFMKQGGIYKELIELLCNNVAYGENIEPLSKEAVENLYGNMLSGSISKFQTFSNCPMQFYLSYGLHLDEKDEGEFDSLARGNLLHGALYEFCTELINNGLDIETIDDVYIAEHVASSFEKAVKKVDIDELKETKRNLYTVEVLWGILIKTVKRMKEIAKETGLKPVFAEKKFILNDDGMEGVKVDNNHVIKMNGTIDRVDVKDEDKELLFKIIDYKSSSRTFDISKAYDGVELQLLTYINAAYNLLKEKYKDKDISMAGSYFYGLKNPIVKDSGDDEKNEKELRKETSESGITVFNNEGKKTNDKYDENEIEVLREFANHKARAIAKRILAGDIKDSPYKEGYDRTACGFCPYKGVCTFDTSFKRCEYRVKTKGDKDEVLLKMQKDIKGEEGNE